MVNNLYKEEDAAISTDDNSDMAKKLRLRERTTTRLINGDVGYRVCENNGFSCPFCHGSLTKCSYLDLLVHAHDVASTRDK